MRHSTFFCRETLSAIGMYCSVLLLVCAHGFSSAQPIAFAESPEPAVWTLAVLGDQQFAVTQKHGHEWLDRFTSQTKWLAENAEKINLRMVVQVGDIVEDSKVPTEWERAIRGMQTLDAAKNADGGKGIPWCVAYGNHEILGATTKPTEDLAGPTPSATYRQYFGSAGGAHRYANQPEFKGVSPNDLNTWHIIKSSKSPDARSYLVTQLRSRYTRTECRYAVRRHRLGTRYYQ